MLWITGADQSTMLLAAGFSVLLSLLSNSKRSKFKWTLLFNERHVMIRGVVLFQI